MRLSMLLPLLLLLAVTGGWVMAGISARRRIELGRRLETVVSGRPLSPRLNQGTSIRVRGRQSPRLQKAALLLKIPLNLPLAHIVPPALVFVASTVLACIAFWIANVLTSRSVSIVAAVVVWVVLVRGAFALELGRYQALLVRQLPDTIQLVVSATRAGLPVSEAFHAIAEEMASPTRDEFVRVERDMALGSTPDEALLAMHERTGVAEYAIFAVTLGVQARSGGRLAETIQNLAETVRERLAIGDRAKALAGEAKLSAIFMCVLPVIAGVFLSIVNPKHMSVLFHDPRGVRMLSFGIVTLILGIASMQALIRGATRD
ncbi:MAG: type II secretion system F family protein [Rhodopila sp.]